jgi:cysteinyl-tRNA synthetase
MADKRLQLKIKKEYEDADSIRKEIRDQWFILDDNWIDTCSIKKS